VKYGCHASFTGKQYSRRNIVAMKTLYATIIIGALTTAANAASAAIVISEVDPFGSNSTDGYSEDWFELTNTGTSAVSIAGWSMLDNHAASNTTTPYAAGASISIGNLSGGNKTFGAALLTLANGQSSIAAGQSVVFLESSTAAASATISGFESAWFGANAPAGLALGTYSDGGNYGLSQTADMVNIFSGSAAGSALIASVAFGDDSGTPTSTFDNAAGLNNATLTQKSVAGINGAFLSANGLEIGSPGSVSAVPLPGSYALLLSALGAFGLGVRRKARNVLTL
jgi:Lamin Tail Domain/PEP-CTERM motif